MIKWNNIRSLWRLKAIVVAGVVLAGSVQAQETGLKLTFHGSNRPPIQLPSGTGLTISNFGAGLGLRIELPGNRPPIQLPSGTGLTISNFGARPGFRVELPGTDKSPFQLSGRSKIIVQPNAQPLMVPPAKPR